MTTSNAREGSVLSLASLTKLPLTRRRVWGGPTVLTSDVISMVYFVFQRPFCASLPCFVFWTVRPFPQSGFPFYLDCLCCDPITYRLTSKSHWCFSIRCNESHERRREVSVQRRKTAIVLPSALPNHPLFFLRTVCAFKHCLNKRGAGRRLTRGQQEG